MTLDAIRLRPILSRLGGLLLKDNIDGFYGKPLLAGRVNLGYTCEERLEFRDFWTGTPYRSPSDAPHGEPFMPTFEGDFSPPSGRFAIVASRFNALVTEALLAGSQDAFVRHGVSDDKIDVVWVPGSFEVPLTARVLAETGKYVAVICLGCVIRGETGHYDLVAGQAAAGIMSAGLSTGVPVIFGVLTTETVEQALNRSGLKAGNKGAEAAMAAIEMVNLLKNVRNGTKGDGSGFGFPGTT